MSLERPELLLGIPLILAWFLWLRRRAHRTPRTTTTYLLWHRAAQGLGPTNPTTRRPPWGDLVRWLPALLAVVAAAGPVTHSTRSSDGVILMDASASMARRWSDDGSSETLWQAGLTLARGALPRGEVRTVPSYLDPLAGASAATVLPAELTDAALALHRRGIPVVVVTDQPLPQLPPEVGIVGLVAPGGNAGITAAGFDPHGSLLVRVAGDGSVKTRELVIASGRGQIRVPVDVAAGPWRRVFQPTELPGGSAEEWSLTLEPAGDANPLDDQVVVLQAQGSLVVGFPETGHDDLWRAFAAHPRVRGVRGSTHADLWIAEAGDGTSESRLWVGGQGPAGSAQGAPSPAEGILRPTRGTLVVGDRPVRFPALYPPPASGQPFEVLVSVADRPLLICRAEVYWLLAEPTEAWSQQASFPLLVAFLVEERLAGRPAEGVRAGPVVTPSGTIYPGPGVFSGPSGRISCGVLSEWETRGVTLESPLQRPPTGGAESQRTLWTRWILLAAAVLGVAVFWATDRAARPRTP